MLLIWHWPQGVSFTVTENFDTKKRVLQLKKLKMMMLLTEQSIIQNSNIIRWSSWDFSRLKFPGKPQGNRRFWWCELQFYNFCGKKIGSNVHYFSGTKKKEVKSVEISWEMLKSLFDFHAISMTRIFFILKHLFSKCEKYVLFVQDRGLFSIAASPRKK